jgi:hypothetical protein
MADDLADRGDLDPEQCAAVGVLVAAYLKKHGGAPEKSLAAVPVAPSPPSRPGGRRGDRHGGFSSKYYCASTPGRRQSPDVVSTGSACPPL